MNPLTKEMRKTITPFLALELLKNGNERFKNKFKINQNLLLQANETSDNQKPFAVIVSCSDSHTSNELIFDQRLGDIFTIWTAGNSIDEDILASLELVCKLSEAKIIVVLGHTECVAMNEVCNAVETGNPNALLAKSKPNLENIKSVVKSHKSQNKELVHKAAVIQVKQTVNAILEKSSILKEKIESGSLGILGGMYTSDTGIVQFYPDTMTINSKWVNE